MPDTLSALDATFLELEERDEGALMSIGGVMVFDPPPGGGIPTIEEVRDALARRLERLPRYSQRLSSPRTRRLARPHWVADEHFDVRNHLSRAALPAPGGSAELCDWAADFYSHRLDRTRPLWEMVILEGLEDGRWALAQKTHHCLVDGVGSVDVVYALLDAEPNPHESAPEPPASANSGDLVREALPGPPEPIVQATRAGLHAAQGGLGALRHPRQSLARTASLAELLFRDEVIASPHTSLNVPIGSGRRFAAVHASLDELKAIRRGLGGSVNDVVLAACTTGIRKLLLERGEDPPHQGLRAMVPVNLRAASEQLALGNRVTSLFVELPVAEPEPVRRYQEISSSTAELKSSGAAVAATTTLELAELAPPILDGLLTSSVFGARLFNVTITNVPGPQIPLYAFGSRLHEIYPIVPLAAEHAVGIAIFSYCGRVVFGAIADAASTPDLATLAYGIEGGIAELADLLPGATRANKFEKART